jgi:nucleotide-binding universal stress UspA family protein
VVRGPALEVLREVASGAGLLVVARHTSSRLAFHALGRTARALLHDPPCPLMLTPPSGPSRKPPSRLLRDVPVGTGY